MNINPFLTNCSFKGKSKILKIVDTINSSLYKLCGKKVTLKHGKIASVKSYEANCGEKFGLGLLALVSLPLFAVTFPIKAWKKESRELAEKLKKADVEDSGSRASRTNDIASKLLSKGKKDSTESSSAEDEASESQGGSSLDESSDKEEEAPVGHSAKGKDPEEDLEESKLKESGPESKENQELEQDGQKESDPGSSEEEGQKALSKNFPKHQLAADGDRAESEQNTDPRKLKKSGSASQKGLGRAGGQKVGHVLAALVELKESSKGLSEQTAGKNTEGAEPECGVRPERFEEYMKETSEQDEERPEHVEPKGEDRAEGSSEETAEPEADKGLEHAGSKSGEDVKESSKGFSGQETESPESEESELEDGVKEPSKDLSELEAEGIQEQADAGRAEDIEESKKESLELAAQIESNVDEEVEEPLKDSLELEVKENQQQANAGCAEDIEESKKAASEHAEENSAPEAQDEDDVDVNDRQENSKSLVFTAASAEMQGAVEESETDPVKLEPEAKGDPSIPEPQEEPAKSDPSIAETDAGKPKAKAKDIDALRDNLRMAHLKELEPYILKHSNPSDLELLSKEANDRINALKNDEFFLRERTSRPGFYQCFYLYNDGLHKLKIKPHENLKKAVNDFINEIKEKDHLENRRSLFEDLESCKQSIIRKIQLEHLKPHVLRHKYKDPVGGRRECESRSARLANGDYFIRERFSEPGVCQCVYKDSNGDVSDFDIAPEEDIFDSIKAFIIKQEMEARGLDEGDQESLQEDPLVAELSDAAADLNTLDGQERFLAGRILRFSSDDLNRNESEYQDRVNSLALEDFFIRKRQSVADEYQCVYRDSFGEISDTNLIQNTELLNAIAAFISGRERIARLIRSSEITGRGTKGQSRKESAKHQKDEENIPEEMGLPRISNLREKQLECLKDYILIHSDPSDERKVIKERKRKINTLEYGDFFIRERTSAPGVFQCYYKDSNGELDDIDIGTDENLSEAINDYINEREETAKLNREIKELEADLEKEESDASELRAAQLEELKDHILVHSNLDDIEKVIEEKNKRVENLNNGDYFIRERANKPGKFQIFYKDASGIMHFGQIGKKENLAQAILAYKDLMENP